MGAAASSSTPVHPSHLAPPQSRIDAALASGMVVPCQAAGCYAPDRFHANVAGAERGFFDAAARSKWSADNHAALARCADWGDVDFGKVDPAFATTYGNVGGTGFTL